MKIGVKGQPSQLDELRRKLPEHIQIEAFKVSEMDGYDVVFDMDFDDDPELLDTYADQQDLRLILGAVKIQLEELPAVLGRPLKCRYAGLNTLPTFIDRSLAEMTVLDKADTSWVEDLFGQLEWEVRFVESRVGMVTPRIVCMIINEAYYTIQEGTASREDIDLGMKLGTAYPKGPFEWCEEIGLVNVYEVLNALYDDTKDERYKICPLLKTEYLKELAS